MITRAVIAIGGHQAMDPDSALIVCLTIIVVLAVLEIRARRKEKRE